VIYLIVVASTMLLLPAASIVVDAGSAPLLWLVGKWFVFWAVGARLILAGLRQYLQPAFTSRDIMGIESAEVFVLVRELGGANVASGVLGLASIAAPSFVLPTAISAGIFYAVAGAEHARADHRGKNELVAMVSDFWATAILLGFAAAWVLTGGLR